MSVQSLPRTRLAATLVTAAFALAFVVTAAYYAGLVPGVPKTLPTFVDLVAVTTGLFVAAVLAWVASLVWPGDEADH